jgi:hypothetical protein
VAMAERHLESEAMGYLFGMPLRAGIVPGQIPPKLCLRAAKRREHRPAGHRPGGCASPVSLAARPICGQRPSASVNLYTVQQGREVGVW